MRHKRRNKDRQERGNLPLCAVLTCGHPACQRHHYIPWRFVPENVFTLPLCEEHHKLFDQHLHFLEERESFTPLKLFKIMFELIYGRGAAYRPLKIGEWEARANQPRVSVHESSGLRWGDS